MKDLEVGRKYLSFRRCREELAVAQKAPSPKGISESFLIFELCVRAICRNHSAGIRDARLLFLALP